MSKTSETIAQYVIDNRYPSKVSNDELYHYIIDSINDQSTRLSLLEKLVALYRERDEVEVFISHVNSASYGSEYYTDAIKRKTQLTQHISQLREEGKI